MEPSLEARADGSLLLTALGGARWGAGLAGIGGGTLLAAGTARAGSPVLEGAIVLPLALISVLAGVAALRHRDWVLFDRAGRAVVHRRGLRALFRSAGRWSFDDVRAITVVETTPGVLVGLAVGDGRVWPLARSDDADYVQRLVSALREVGGWRVRTTADSDPRTDGRP